MLSRRVPGWRTPNAWTLRVAALRQAGQPPIDLTIADPTHVGLTDDGAATLAAPTDAGLPAHQPDPMGLRVAREAIAADANGRGLTLAPENVMLTSGTSESYAHLFRLLADPGDVVLVPEPSYPLFEPIAALEAVALASYRLTWDGAWHLDVDSLDRAFAGAAPGRVRAVVIVQPNHPTGTCLAANELAAIEARCELHGAALISDEVFAPFPRDPARAWLPSALPGPSTGEASRVPSSAAYGERRVPTFVLDGLSKRCGMPQLKLGWIALAGPGASCAEARAGLEWIGDTFLSVGSPVQRSLPRLLTAGAVYRERVRARIATQLECLARLVEAHPELSPLAADGGWSALLRMPSRLDDEAWALAMLDHGVMIHPGHFFDIGYPPCIVVSLLPEPDRFAQGIDRVARALAAY